MKTRTRWRKIKSANILGKSFTDYGEYGLGNFTIKKIYKCKVYVKYAMTPTHSHWFDKERAVVVTEQGIKYKLPFCPYLKYIKEVGTQKSLGEYYNEHPW